MDGHTRIVGNLRTFSAIGCERREGALKRWKKENIGV
jgi:hypothetical protein